MSITGNVNDAIERTLNSEFFADAGNRTDENHVCFVHEVVTARLVIRSEHTKNQFATRKRGLRQI